MIEEFFSERELGKETLISEEINYNVYNGILNVYKKYIKGFAKTFPSTCPDSDNNICGTNENLLKAEVKALIPDFDFKFKEEYDYIDKDKIYAILDFIEYCYDNIIDYEDGYHHIYYNHTHLSFKETKESREKFRNEVNRIFQRNRVIFSLDKDGKMKRALPLEMDTIIKNINLETSDERLNELIGLAIENIQAPKLIDRIVGLEKLWDAFERMKTYYSAKKNKSAEQLVNEVSTGTDKFDEVLNTEFRYLTTLGNDLYQIRHFETNKIEIKSSAHIDYLFYRMIALINLCVSILNK